MGELESWKGSGNESFPCRKVMKTVGCHGEPEIASQSASRILCSTKEYSLFSPRKWRFFCSHIYSIIKLQ